MEQLFYSQQARTRWVRFPSCWNFIWFGWVFLEQKSGAERKKGYSNVITCLTCLRRGHCLPSYLGVAINIETRLLDIG